MIPERSAWVAGVSPVPRRKHPEAAKRVTQIQKRLRENTRWPGIEICRMRRELGLLRSQSANDIKGALSLRFAAIPLIELMIIGAFNHRPPSPPKPRNLSWIANSLLLRAISPFSFRLFRSLCVVRGLSGRFWPPVSGSGSAVPGGRILQTQMTV